jgi:hypothetical protein
MPLTSAAARALRKRGQGIDFPEDIQDKADKLTAEQEAAAKARREGDGSSGAAVQRGFDTYRENQKALEEEEKRKRGAAARDLKGK